MHYKLTYFDFDGGRGETVRIALHAAGIEFEDERLAFAEFGARVAEFRFRALPVLAIDGEQVSQSDALNRYVGRLAGLYPEDAVQAMYCDEVMGAIEDLNHYIMRTFGLEGDELRRAREKLASGWMTTIVSGIADLLQRGGGEYFAAGKLTVADLKSFIQMRSLTSGKLDHIPADLVQRVAPALVEHSKRVAEDPRVVAYYASRK